jgi:hypothetical protein
MKEIKFILIPKIKYECLLESENKLKILESSKSLTPMQKYIKLQEAMNKQVLEFHIK